MRNHNQCKNLNTDFCIIDFSCEDCYYYEEKELICKNCGRHLPNNNFLTPLGCLWCIQKNE